MEGHAALVATEGAHSPAKSFPTLEHVSGQKILECQATSGNRVTGEQISGTVGGGIKPAPRKEFAQVVRAQGYVA